MEAYVVIINGEPQVFVGDKLLGAPGSHRLSAQDRAIQAVIEEVTAELADGELLEDALDAIHDELSVAKGAGGKDWSIDIVEVE